MGGGFMTYWSSSVVYVALLPIFVVSHELGHAAVSLTRSRAPVAIAIGRPPGRWCIRRGRVNLTIGLNFWSYRKPAGWVSQVPLDTWSTLACGVAGPLAEACASALLIPIGVAMDRPLVGDAGIFGIAISLASLVPFRRHGYRNDGANLLYLLRCSAADRLAAQMLAAWLVLVRDLDSTLGRERGRVLDAVPHLVEHPGKGPDALGVWRLAFAGWCWRAVSGDAWREMRDAALDALHHARRTGAVEPDLTIIASRALAASESPAGFEHMPSALRSIPVDDAKQRWAFRFGAAFYDIEQARGSIG